MKKHSRLRSFFLNFLAVFFGWFILEFGMFSAKWVYYQTRPAPLKQALLANLPGFHRHPLWMGFDFGEMPQKAVSVFDPYLGHRYPALTDLDGRGTDRYGFIHNGDANREIDLSDKTTRVVLLGGSSMAGTGVHDNRETIGGHLEKILNQSGKGRFQVINAGVGGYYSPHAIKQLVIELIHFNPSIVLVMDGFNDFWHSFVPAKDAASDGDWAIPNRNSYEQSLLDAQSQTQDRKRAWINTVERLTQPNLIHRVFFYSTTWLRDQLVKAAQKMPESKSEVAHDPLASDVWRANARWLRDHRYHSPSHAPYYMANWESILDVCRSRNIKVGLFLQPFLPNTGHALTPEEEKRYTDFLAARPHFTRIQYEESARRFYSEVRAILTPMASRHRDERGVRIEDISSIFDGIHEPIFMDNVHYNSRGNELLARKFADLIFAFQNRRL